MKNHFYTIIQFIKDRFEADPDVNTVTHGNNLLTDDNKKNIFPIVHITVQGMSFPPGYIAFDFEIGVLDQRVIRKEDITDKFLRNDNELDILNTCAEVLNKFILTLQSQYVPHDIALFNDPTPEPIELAYTNTLDGWSVALTIGIPNKATPC